MGLPVEKGYSPKWKRCQCRCEDCHPDVSKKMAVMHKETKDHRSKDMKIVQCSCLWCGPVAQGASVPRCINMAIDDDPKTTVYPFCGGCKHEMETRGKVKKFARIKRPNDETAAGAFRDPWLDELFSDSDKETKSEAKEAKADAAPQVETAPAGTKTPIAELTASGTRTPTGVQTAEPSAAASSVEAEEAPVADASAVASPAADWNE